MHPSCGVGALLVPLLWCWSVRAAQESARTRDLQLWNYSRHLTSVKCVSFPGPADASSTCVSGASTLSHIHTKHRIMDWRVQTDTLIYPFPVTGRPGFLCAYADLKHRFI